MLGVSEPGALNCYTLFRFIPLTLFISRNLTFNFSSSFRIPGFSALQSHGTHSRSGIFSTDVANASGGVIIFVKQCLSFSELSTSSLSLLGPYSDYVEVNISLNDSFSLSFLNVYAPPIRSSTKDSRTNFFSLHSSLLCGSGSGEFFALPLPLPQKKYRFHRFRFRSASASTSLNATLDFFFASGI